MDDEITDSSIEIAEDVYLNLGKVTVILILFSCLVYLADLVYGINSQLAYGATRPLYTIITSIFAHANFVHLFYNILNLFIFGSLIELHYGSRFTFAVFIMSALIANLTFAVFDPLSSVIGISGVVYAFIGAAVVLAPNAKIPLPIGGIAFPMKVWFAGPIMAIGEFILTFVSFDNIAHIAHASGFAVGLVLAAMLRKREGTRLKLSEPTELHP
jgi:membrane associated rhomboid family serine protease